MNQIGRQYYSARSGKTRFDLNTFKEAYLGIYLDLKRKGYFDQYFGYECEDEGHISGVVGYDVKNFFLRKLKKQNLWPIEDNIAQYTKDDLFDVMELVFDCASKPMEDSARSHGWNNQCVHFDKFAKGLGWYEYQNEVNQILRDLDYGYEINRSGEIIILGDPGLNSLMTDKVSDENTNSQVIHAVNIFRNRNASQKDKEDAVITLAGILESLRKKMSGVVTTKDENDLFNIANNFGIRHKNDKQKTEYDKDIWLSWMFYYYLATIHAITRLINKSK